MKRRLSELATLIGGRVIGDPERWVRAVRALDQAGAEDLSPLISKRHFPSARFSQAGAMLAAEPLIGVECDWLLVDDPGWALAVVLNEFLPGTRPAAGIHPTAVVAGDAVISSTASIGAHVCVGERVEIGDRVIIRDGVSIGSDCRIGEDTEIHPRTVLYPRCEVGRRCLLHSGVVVGSDGFGFVPHRGGAVKLPHLGRVVLEDDVEIGANSTVDRALLEETRIGAGTKIDNLVQVGHNVKIGRHCLLVAQSGIAGSARLGEGVVLAGQAGVGDHVELGNGVKVAAKAAVFASQPASAEVGGVPAIELRKWRRQQALLSRLGEYRKRLTTIERRLGALSKEDFR